MKRSSSTTYQLFYQLQTCQAQTLWISKVLCDCLLEIVTIKLINIFLIFYDRIMWNTGLSGKGLDGQWGSCTEVVVNVSFVKAKDIKRCKMTAKRCKMSTSETAASSLRQPLPASLQFSPLKVKMLRCRHKAIPCHISFFFYLIDSFPIINPFFLDVWKWIIWSIWRTRYCRNAGFV